MEYEMLLQQLNACHGPSGDEKEIGELIRKLAEPYATECYFDVLGNLIVHKKGNGEKLMFAGHMDSIGLIVTFIEEDGYLKVGKIGGVNPQAALYRPIRFKNGTMGVVSVGEKIKKEDITIDNLYIDIGVATRKEAEELVQVGDTAVFSQPAFAMNDALVSSYMDNRISCLVMLEVLKRVASHDKDLYFVFTTQEEVGLRGAKTSSYQIKPDIGIAVDVTQTAEKDDKRPVATVLGNGAAIKVMDQSVICHPTIVETLEELAKKHNITHQREVSVIGGTDAGVIHKSGDGVLTGGVSVPCRYIHSCVEMVNRHDVEACIQLLTAFAEL